MSSDAELARVLQALPDCVDPQQSIADNVARLLKERSTPPDRTDIERFNRALRRARPLDVTCPQCGAAEQIECKVDERDNARPGDWGYLTDKDAKKTHTGRVFLRAILAVTYRSE